MAIFPDAWLSELLSKSDLAAIASEYTLLKPKGKRLWGCCPFHSEKTGSFSVSPGISGAAATPSRSPEAVSESFFLSPRSTVSTASSSPRCSTAARPAAAPPREDERRVEAWPQAVSAVHAANPANNTRERIRTFIFISLQECGKYTARNQRLFALTLIPER